MPSFPENPFSIRKPSQFVREFTICIQKSLGSLSGAQFGIIQIWRKSIKKALNFFKAGGDEWIRTTDSRIFSPMLYQLSYITLIK